MFCDLLNVIIKKKKLQFKFFFFFLYIFIVSGPFMVPVLKNYQFVGSLILHKQNKAICDRLDSWISSVQIGHISN